MDSIKSSKKPHALCIPFPAQGHINPMLKLAKMLYNKGIKITFVNTIFNHNRLLRSRGPTAVAGLPDFRFESISDGLPPCNDDVTQSMRSLFEYTPKHCLDPLVKLIRKLNECDSPVSCIISDGAMSFTLKAAEEFGVPDVLFWTPSACGLLCYTQYRELVERGLTPLKGVLLDGKLDGRTKLRRYSKFEVRCVVFEMSGTKVRIRVNMKDHKCRKLYEDCSYINLC